MVIENLPRLADEERDALEGGYVAIAGVPTGDISVDDLIAERIDALKAMRGGWRRPASYGAPPFLLPKPFPAVLRWPRRLRREGGES